MNKSKSKKSIFSRVNAWLHLWLGIFTGIILVFVALTGTIVVYSDEIIELSAGKSRYVESVKEQKIPLETLLLQVKKDIPKANVSEATVYKDPKRTLRLRVFSKGNGLSFVYVDPYSGKILKNDRTANFFYIMAHLHASFMWHGTGEWIVDIATIIFLIELISGIVLWWPKKWNKHTRDASFKIKWNAKFKRVNYDLHNVLGFYSSLLALILTITGLLIAFQACRGQHSQDIWW
ncbi:MULTISPECIES: PepSY-associated TM helix domain-containing protein [Chitinophagaceae]